MKIEKMSPAIKLAVLIFITLLGSLDYMPYSSILLILLGLLITALFSEIPVLKLLRSIRLFMVITVIYTLFLLMARWLSGLSLELEAVFGLSLRMVVIGLFSSLFVKTTDPIELVLCLIHYYRMPPRVGFAFMSAYRFLPTFHEEWLQIVNAHRIRGCEASQNPLIRAWEIKRYLIPLLAGAIRKGVRLSVAMETRAFGKYPERTTYRTITLEKKHLAAGILFACLVLGIMITLTHVGLTRLSLFYQG